MMKAMTWVAAVLAAGTVFGGALDLAWIKGTTDKDPITYKAGEKMVFTLSFEGIEGQVPEGEFFLDWKRSGDDGVVDGGRIPVTGKPFVYETKIDKPGFVRIQANVVDKDGKRYVKKFTGDATTPEGRAAMNRFERQNKAVFFDGGAGADIETLRTEPEPKDFDAFWRRQLAELKTVPMDANVENVEIEDKSVDCYRLSIPCSGGRPATGYMTVPKGPKDAKWPLTISFHGYGTFKQTAPKDGPKDKIDISINAHGYELGRESDYYKEFWKGVKLNERGQYGMDLADNARPETSYFRGMVLRAVRAVEWAKTLKNWDGRNLRVWGGSQGGMQSLWVAALVDGITELEPIVPWGADIIGKTKGRYSFPALRLEYAPGLDYYDTVNFAKRIPATCRVNISRSGLGDIHCPPSGQWLLYRAIKAPKSITFLQNSNHGGAPGGKEKNQHTTYSEGVAADAPKNAESSATAVLGDAWNK